MCVMLAHCLYCRHIDTHDCPDLQTLSLEAARSADAGRPGLEALRPYHLTISSCESVREMEVRPHVDGIVAVQGSSVALTEHVLVPMVRFAAMLASLSVVFYSALDVKDVGEQ